MTMKIISESVNDTLKLGKLIAKNLHKGDILCLFGELGCGKTVLTKGIAQGLGIKSSKIISPSFVLIREHLKGRLPLYHFDLYRLKDAHDILALGYEEYLFDDGVTVVEWADRLKYLIPKELLKISLKVTGEKKRSIEISASGQQYEEMVHKLKIKRRTV